MRVRAGGLVATVIALLAIVALVTLPAIGITSIPAGARAVEGMVGVIAACAVFRVTRLGLDLEPQRVVVTNLLTTDRVARREVLGLAVQPIAWGRLQRLVVVCVDGRILPAVWALARPSNAAWVTRAAWLAQGFGPTQPQVEPTLSVRGRLAAGGALPVATSEPELTPATVSPAPPGPQTRWLGWETIFVVAAFALPGVAGALSLLVKHIVTGRGLNEFALPIKHHPGASVVVLIMSYLTTALVVPIALLLLARTGQPPKALGLATQHWRRDLVGGLGLLGGVWIVNLATVVPLFVLLGNSLTNPQSNSHVPAYFVVYGLSVALTTAINEEVIVNGYFLTRLAQLGYSPRVSFAISLAVRTSYHVYYGLGFLATVPFGWVVTRSFQKRGRLARPILAHFLYDAILLTVAVLTS